VSAQSRSAVALAALLAGAGASHFAVPGYYDAMIPDLLPGRPRQWTTGAGVAEFAVAAAILAPPTRRAGALAAAALFAAVLPADVKVAVDARKSDSPAFRMGTILRLPMQWPLIAWALKVRRES
jgi:uncharacterized membrane protein